MRTLASMLPPVPDRLLALAPVDMAIDALHNESVLTHIDHPRRYRS